VGNSNIEGIEVALSPGMEVTGTVRVEGDPAVPPSSVRLMLEPKDFTPFGGGASAMIKDDGTFVFRNVTPDTYRIRAFGPQGPIYAKSIVVGQQEVKAGEFSIDPGTPPALAIVLSSTGGHLTGSVKGEKDVAQGATVVLIPANRQRVDLYRTASTDQYGRFAISTVPPGEYKLFAWDDVENGQWLDPDFLQVYENSGKSVSTREASKGVVDLQLLVGQAAAPAQ
jgi:hypothetical protein